MTEEELTNEVCEFVKQTIEEDAEFIIPLMMSCETDEELENIIQKIIAVWFEVNEHNLIE